MSRLTMYNQAEGKNTFISLVGDETILERAADKLAKYEIADQAGLLIKTQCKIGDSVYIPNYAVIHDEETHGIKLSDVLQYTEDKIDSIMVNKELTIVYGIGFFPYEFTNTDFGSSVFLDKPED